MELFSKYLNSLQKYDISSVTEHTYRLDLQNLLEDICSNEKIKVSIVHEPKRLIGFGAPDFKVKSIEAIIGYIENKKLGEDLKKTLKSDQILKYKSLSSNIIVTNYLDWAWVKDGEVIAFETICELDEITSGFRVVVDPVKIKKVKNLLISFFNQVPKGIGKPKQLAEALAVRARYLRDFLLIELERQVYEHQEGRLYGLYQTFKTNVFSDLTIKEFSDAFSQTLVYGLFLAKLNARSQIIDLYNAKKFILPAFGLIRELVDFLDVLERKEYQEAKWIVEEITSVMNTLNLRSISKSLSYEKFKSKNLFDEENVLIRDPYIYFYEHFLAAYDKKLRKSKGVYYTPPQVVNFIVKSINIILKETFFIEKGYADSKRVTVLDFATGTGTFLLEILEQAFDELPSNSGKRNSIIKEHFLKNFYGFEYLIAPYTVANLKLSQFLKDQGYILENDDRFQIYLTNTLEPVNSQLNIPLLPALSNETKAAQLVKDRPVLVITGNPPYSGISNNKGAWITNLIDDYKYIDDKHFNEKKHWLGDDYVKFIRFAQWKMDQVEQGVVGIITNHRFISNPTFRGMRQSLMKSFDQIYIFDLHGSNKPKEHAPNGGIDENVFDIEQGVAISFFIKKKGIEKKFKYLDLFGSREEKYNFCIQNEINSVNWVDIIPSSPYYLFNNTIQSKSSSYNSFIPIDEIFPFSKLPLMTGRDVLSVHHTKLELEQVLKDLSEKSEIEIRKKYKLQADKSNWNLPNAIADVKDTKSNPSLIRDLYYRPFDKRLTYYTGKTNGIHSRPQYSVNQHLVDKENFGLIVGRAGQNVDSSVLWNLIFIADDLVDLNMFSRGGAMLFPLYLYVNESGMFKSHTEPIPNVNQAVIDKFSSHIGLKIKPEGLLGYIYSILHSRQYRKKYKENLQIDFPRIPLPQNKEDFKELNEIGWALINAHLLKKIPKGKDFNFGDYLGTGDNVVKFRRFKLNPKGGEGRIFINESQYFNNIPESVWLFQIGGYQVLDKYLKDRKDRILTHKEIEIVEDIIKVLWFTEKVMDKINTLTKIWI